MRKPPSPTADRAGRRLFAAIGLLVALPLLFAADYAIRLDEKVLASAERKYGAPARARLESWTRLIATHRGRPEAEKLALVNDFFNQVPFIPDDEHWSVPDYWATPAELLASNGGDCEDYSIAKYFTLLALGVDLGKLRITYVKARSLPPAAQAHMVLTYYPRPDAVPLVLDNLNPVIHPATARPDLQPVYSFNGDGLWLAKERGAGRVEGGAGRIGLWTQLNARLGKEFD